MKLNEAIKSEFAAIRKGVIAGTILMFVGFVIGHLALPEMIPLDYRVFLSGAAGAAVAIGSFYNLAMTVQKIADDPDPEKGKRKMQVSYSKRMMIQGLWAVVAFTVPVFQWAAGVLPLLFPRITISVLQLTGRFRPADKGGEA